MRRTLRMAPVAAVAVALVAACAGSATGFSIDKSKTLLLGQLTHGASTDGVHEEITRVAIVSQMPKASKNLIAMIEAGVENVDITHHFDSEFHFDSASVTATAKPGQRKQFAHAFSNVEGLMKGAAVVANGNPQFFEPSFPHFRGIALETQSLLVHLAAHKGTTVTQKAGMAASAAALTAALPLLTYNESPDHHPPTSARSLFTLTISTSCGACGVLSPHSLAARTALRAVEKSAAWALSVAATVDHGGALHSRARTVSDALSAYRGFQAVGHAFHAAQDFFAHSNYVELLAGVEVEQPIRAGTRVAVPTKAAAFNLGGIAAVLRTDYTKLETGASNAIWLKEGDYCLGSPYNPRTSLTIPIPAALAKAFGLPKSIKTPALGGSNPKPPPGLNYCHYKTRTTRGMNKDEPGRKEPSHVNHQVAKKAATDMTTVLWRDFLAPLKRPVAAPALTGLTLPAATGAAGGVGLGVAPLTRACTPAELGVARGGGHVLTQSPAAGRGTRPGSKVAVVVCKGEASTPIWDACKENTWNGTWQRVEHAGTVTFGQSGKTMASGKHTWFGGGSFTGMTLSDGCRTLVGQALATKEIADSYWQIRLTSKTSFAGNWRWATTPKGSWNGSFGGKKK